MYHIYHTPGFILESRPFGESNRLFYIYTESFGNVVATAQGVRELKSKLRFSLTDFSLSDVSIVRGKEIWRITSADSIVQYHNCFEKNAYGKLVAHIFGMVKRLVPGEAQNKELFSVLQTFFLFIQKENNLSNADLLSVEYITNLQILATLGYASDKPTLAPFLNAPLSKDLLRRMEGSKTLAIKEINTTLAQSQL